MSGGVGRGRGWLQLKTQNTKHVPGLENNSTSPNLDVKYSSKPSPLDNRHFSDVSSEYSNLISNIKQLDINDDGIKFNQKIKYIIECWSQDCGTAPDVESSFDAIFQTCLEDMELASKLVILIASRTFLSQEIHEQNIRLMFLRKLQDNFENSVKLQSSNPKMFRNSVQIMGEFYNKARLANGKQFSFMITPLISYLDMLLESAELEDLRLFTIQLYLNGSSVNSECPEKIAEVLTKVRLMLCSDQKLAKECKLWLLLAVEVAVNRFSILPTDAHKFYQEQLGDHAMACFQGTHGALTIQTPNVSKTLQNYQSNVNVLQVMASESLNDSVPAHNSGSELCNSSGFQSDTSQNSLVNRGDGQTNKANKTGRPILGAGARLQRNRIQQNEASEQDHSNSTNWSKNKPQNDKDNWNRNKSSNDKDSWSRNKPHGDREPWSQNKMNDKDNKSANQVKQRISGDWEKKKTPPKQTSKGWEHDDRFEHDYN